MPDDTDDFTADFDTLKKLGHAVYIRLAALPPDQLAHHLKALDGLSFSPIAGAHFARKESDHNDHAL